MKMTLTHACGCKCFYDIFGNRAAKERRIWAIENSDCPECRKKKNLEKAKKVAEEMALPELKGTEKQVTWAETLRIGVIRKMKEYASDDAMELIDVICTEDNADFWIEHRDDHFTTLFSIAAKMKKEAEEIENLAEVSTEKYIVKSEEDDGSHLVRIEMLPDRAHFQYEKNNQFIKIMHKHECEWENSKWVKKTSCITPSIEDLVAEIGADLLSHGYTVDFPTKETMDKAINEDYEVECHRWIRKRAKGDYEGWFAVCWPGKSDTLYEAARRIKGSRWNSGNVVVPPQKYNELLDFCDKYNFRLTPAAEGIVKKQKAEIENAVIVKAKPAEKAEKAVKKSGAILEDLMDD